MTRKGYLTLFVILLTFLLSAGTAFAGKPGGGTTGGCGSGCTYYLSGNAADVTKTTSPGLLLMGGGTDVDAAMQWMISKSGGGDFVVIRASGADGYNPYIYSELGGVDSVETMVIGSRRAAANVEVATKIRAAEALFIAGGNQADYVNYWKGTPVEDAIQYLVTKGVPIGGTSAGLAILGEFLYSAQNLSVLSSEALGDPYHRYVTLDRDFLLLPTMAGKITDSHFDTRDRMGRLLAFMARIQKDGWAATARGLGVSEQTAFAVDGNGSGQVMGSGAVYFLASTQAPEVCVAGQPLTYRNVSVYKAGPGATFNLTTWTGSGGTAYSLSAVNGTLTSTQTGGKIY